MDSKKIVGRSIARIILLTFLSWQISPYVYADDLLKLPATDNQTKTVSSDASTQLPDNAWPDGQGPGDATPGPDTLDPGIGPLSLSKISDTPLASLEKDTASYFKFNDNTGSLSFADSVPGSPEVRCQGWNTNDCPQSGVAGKLGQAIHFDGNSLKNQLLRIDNSSNAVIPANSAAFSVGFWFKADQVPASDWMAILSNETAEKSGFRCGIKNGNLVFWSNESGGNLSLTSSQILTSGSWYQAVIS